MRVRDRARVAFDMWQAIHARGYRRAAKSSRWATAPNSKRTRQPIGADRMGAPIRIYREPRRRRHERAAECPRQNRRWKDAWQCPIEARERPTISFSLFRLPFGNLRPSVPTAWCHRSRKAFVTKKGTHCSPQAIAQRPSFSLAVSFSHWVLDLGFGLWRHVALSFPLKSGCRDDHRLQPQLSDLEVELLLAGVAQTGPNARSMLGLDDPFLDWVKTSEGFGVPAVAVDSAEALARHLERALMHRAPFN